MVCLDAYGFHWGVLYLCAILRKRCIVVAWRGSRERLRTPEHPDAMHRPTSTLHALMLTVMRQSSMLYIR